MPTAGEARLKSKSLNKTSKDGYEQVDSVQYVESKHFCYKVILLAKCKRA